MPNPIAHPAASIPFAKTGMVFSALVIGSISPDFGYLFPLPSPYFMNTAPGLILFDFPIGFVLLWIFHIFLKWPLLSLLPENLQRCLFKHARGFTFGPLKRFGLICFSLLLGSITHVVWDSFTHEYGWVVEKFAILRILIGSTPLYSVLQSLSTLLGVILLLYQFISWQRNAPKNGQLPAHFSNKVRNIFFILNAVSLVVVEGAIIYSRIITGTRFVLEHFLMDSITISAVIIILFSTGIYCLAWMVTFHKTLSRVK